MLKLPKLSQLLGTNTPRSPYRTQQTNALGNLSKYRTGTYNSLRTGGAAGVSQVAPQRQSAFNQYSSLLRSPAGDDSRDALALGRMTSQTNRAGEAARARTQAGIRRMGISGGAAAGALANLEAGQLAQEGQANTALALDRIDRNERRAAALYGLTRGEQADYQNQELMGSQGLDNLAAQEFDAYGQMAREDEQRRAAEKQATMSALTGLGSLYGSFTGLGRRGTGGMPAPTTVNSLAGYRQIDAPTGMGGNYVVGPDGYVYEVG